MFKVTLYGDGVGTVRRKLYQLTTPVYDPRDDVAAVVSSLAAVLAKSPTLARIVRRVTVERLLAPSVPRKGTP